VVLAAYERWGEKCLDRFIGMFVFAIWDDADRRLFIARDRFGIKPLYYSVSSDGTLHFASEIRSLHAGGVPATGNESTWATYLAFGLHDHSAQTFWSNISSLPAGHSLTWRDCKLRTRTWYDTSERIGPDFDERPADTVQDEYI